MPEIVRFYGIIIKMFFKPKEHEPAHIHALYNEYVGVFDIHTNNRQTSSFITAYDTSHQVLHAER